MIRNTMIELRYTLYLIFHPFNGFWEIKREKKGSLTTAGIILSLFVIFQILSKRLTGVLFNSNDIASLNISKEILTILLVFLVWCVSNWALTTIMDGEGGFVDIVKMTSYSLVPMVLFSIPLIMLSNYLSLRESAFYVFFTSLAQWWFLFLLFIGTLTTHQYSVFKTIFTVLFTIIGMCLIFFIGLLFFNLIQQMLGFAVNIYKEIAFRVK